VVGGVKPSVCGDIVLAAYGLPGIYAVESLFALGHHPGQIRILTHEIDERNKVLFELARHYGIETKTAGASSTECYQWLRQRPPGVIFSLHYRDRIPVRILEIPQHGCVNLHPSLLPAYAGCFSSAWAIINGEERTGFTYHYMVEDFDAGNILIQKEVPISRDDTAFTLFHRLIVEGMRSFESALERVLAGDKGTPQRGKQSYFPRQLPYGGNIDPLWDEEKVGRFIRAMSFPPFEGATLTRGNKSHTVSSLEEYRKLLSDRGSRTAR
jgi:methionyl-tRNA formyltransferase